MDYLIQDTPVTNALKSKFGDAPTMLGFIRAVVPSQPMTGLELFPTQSTDNLTYEYFVEENRAVPMASVISYRSEAPIMGDITTEKMIGAICKMAQKKVLHEDVIMAIDRAGRGDPQTALRKMEDDAGLLALSIRERQEALRIEALTTGAISVDEAGVKMKLDFGLPDDQQDILYGTSLWSDPNSNPITDLGKWVEYMIKNHRPRPTEAWTSPAVLSCIKRNEFVKLYVYGKDHGGRPVLDTQLNELLTSMRLPTFKTYERVSSVEDPITGQIVNYNPFPDNLVVLVPGGPLGKTLEGPVAEALMDNNVERELRSGLWFNMWRDQDPPAYWQKVAASSLPTFPRIKHIFHATVL